MLIFAQHTSYYQCLQQHCCKGRRGEHYVINYGCLYEPIIKRMVTAVKHSTNHKKSTDIISMIVDAFLIMHFLLVSQFKSSIIQSLNSLQVFTLDIGWCQI